MADVHRVRAGQGAHVGVLVVEDHPVHAQWLMRGAEQAAAPCTIVLAGSLEKARGLLPVSPVAASALKLVLLDLVLPDGNGLDLMPLLAQQAPDAVVLVVSQHSDEERVMAAVLAGARGYIVKDGDSASVSQAIRSALQGQYLMSPPVARLLFERLRTTGAVARPAHATVLPLGQRRHLSPREQQVLEHFATGASYEEVAAMLGVSRSTVETHIRNLYRKLEVSNKAAAVHRAGQLGLLSLHP